MSEKFDVLLDAKKLNQQSLLPTIVFFIISIALYYSIWGFVWDISLSGFLKLYLFSFIGIVVHEFVHGIAFIGIGKAKLSDVKFGVLWKSMTPYAHCKIPLSIRAYKVSLLLPAIVTGIIPLIIGLSMESLLTVIVAAFLTTAGIGDWMMYRKLQPFPSNATVIDHPSEIGCIVEVQ